MENKTTEAPGGKKRGRFNFIDFILIAVALVALGVLVYIVVGPKASKTAQPATFSVQYTVEIKHLREDWRDLIGIGDVVTDADSLTTIGTVTDISYQNGYLAGKKEFCIGTSVALRLPKLRIDSYCKSIEVIGEVNKDAVN